MVATDATAFSYQDLDLRSVRFLKLRLFFSEGVLRGSLRAFLERTDVRLRIAKSSLTIFGLSLPTGMVPLPLQGRHLLRRELRAMAPARR